jgi:lipopolysaccharide transport system permease protein
MAFVTAILCARFRDLIQIVNSVLQVAIFLTPVLWKPELLPPEAQSLMILNPLAVLVTIVRDPLLGRAVPIEFWAAALFIAVGGFLIALPFIGRYRRRFIYWL